mmetsp:Transcript_68942/g.121887  ORF Transcript_68942/g.121887 Transcript_68942/m.121887 type:complete len:264 (+) Transcript_68942:851-1642(+)
MTMRDKSMTQHAASIGISSTFWKDAEFPMANAKIQKKTDLWQPADKFECHVDTLQSPSFRQLMMIPVRPRPEMAAKKYPRYGVSSTPPKMNCGLVTRTTPARVATTARTCKQLSSSLKNQRPRMAAAMTLMLVMLRTSPTGTPAITAQTDPPKEKRLLWPRKNSQKSWLLCFGHAGGSLDTRRLTKRTMEKMKKADPRKACDGHPPSSSSSDSTTVATKVAEALICNAIPRTAFCEASAIRMDIPQPVDASLEGQVVTGKRER